MQALQNKVQLLTSIVSRAVPLTRFPASSFPPVIPAVQLTADGKSNIYTSCI